VYTFIRLSACVCTWQNADNDCSDDDDASDDDIDDTMVSLMTLWSV